jgi:hypothetical protein
MALLFGKGRTTITEHIQNVFSEGELDENSVCRKFRQVRLEGNREVSREIEYYNLDVIISVGYTTSTRLCRVCSKFTTNLKSKHESRS